MGKTEETKHITVEVVALLLFLMVTAWVGIFSVYAFSEGEIPSIVGIFGAVCMGAGIGYFVKIANAGEDRFDTQRPRKDVDITTFLDTAGSSVAHAIMPNDARLFVSSRGPAEQQEVARLLQGILFGYSMSKESTPKDGNLSQADLHCVIDLLKQYAEDDKGHNRDNKAREKDKRIEESKQGSGVEGDKKTNGFHQPLRTLPETHRANDRDDSRHLSLGVTPQVASFNTTRPETNNARVVEIIRKEIGKRQEEVPSSNKAVLEATSTPQE